MCDRLTEHSSAHRAPISLTERLHNSHRVPHLSQVDFWGKQSILSHCFFMSQVFVHLTLPCLLSKKIGNFWKKMREWKADYVRMPWNWFFSWVSSNSGVVNTWSIIGVPIEKTVVNKSQKLIKNWFVDNSFHSWYIIVAVICLWDKFLLILHLNKEIF